ncbi:putative isomerase [Podospora conica]|nr:putative isomerase [Schizothecium conicum]
MPQNETALFLGRIADQPVPRLPLSGTAQQIQKETFTMSGRGPNSRQDKPHPHEVALDMTKNFNVIPDPGADVIRVFRIDHSSGRLLSCSTAQHEKGARPRHIKFWKSAAGVEVAYTVNELGNSVSAFSVAYPNNCLQLTRTQTLTSIPPGKRAGSGTKAAEASIAIYTINPTTGALTWLDAGNSYSHYLRTFEINAAGTLVAIGGQTSANVVIVERDVTTGKLGKLVGNIQLGNKGRAGEEDGLSAVVWVEQ